MVLYSVAMLWTTLSDVDDVNRFMAGSGYRKLFWSGVALVEVVILAVYAA